MADLWICKQADKCQPKDCIRACMYRHTIDLTHIRYNTIKSKANWYRIPCYNPYLSDDLGESIVVRWKENK